MKTRELWLDLEDTIITPVLNGWLNTQLINTEKIRQIQQEFRPDSIHIFSFAIWDQFQLRAFDHGTRPMLEDFLGVKLGVVPTVDDDIIPACCKVMNLAPSTVDFQEMSNFWVKQESFRLFLRAKPRKVEVLFLDDVVTDETFAFPSLGISGKILNIDMI